MRADHGVRNALIRTYLVLLQREIREKNDWYTTQRVVIRKRSGRVQRTRLGSRPSYATQGGFISIDEEPQSGFIVTGSIITPISSFAI
ncbi:hypothetical protein F5X99DRAFT_408506 [Biscogniauxia marginata]|nr:hypothetical protein F5X99DRAFT_408506 [Biscogniauxia marginata]